MSSVPRTFDVLVADTNSLKEDGETKIQLDQKIRDTVLLIGNTGVGKCTISSYCYVNSMNWRRRQFRLYIFGVSMLTMLVALKIALHDWEIRNCKCEKESSNFDDPASIQVVMTEFVKQNDRSTILDEIQNNYVKSHGAGNLSSFKKTVFIVTTHRSGSTFFAEIINSHPAVFYHYEPLMVLNQFSISEEKLEDARNITRELATCNYLALENYMNWMTEENNLLPYNKKIKMCKHLFPVCINRDFLMEVCKLFPIQLLKLVRILISELEPVFKANDNSHIIFLVRDPRATYVSRVKAGMVASIGYDDPQKFCSRMNSNLRSFKILRLQYPHRLHLLQYEELALNPSGKTQELFASLGIPWNSALDDYIEKHTMTHVEGKHSTYRVSESRIHSWKNDIDEELLKTLELHCHESMRELNYTKFI